MSNFIPISDKAKACPDCGALATLDAPEPIHHRCRRRVLAFAPTGRRGRRGLGDSLTAWLKPLAHIFGLDACVGCLTRANVLNRWFPYAANQAVREQAVARLSVCQACDQRIGGVCTMSGRDLPPIVALPETACPARRWPGDAPLAPDSHGRPAVAGGGHAGPIKLPPIDQPARWLVMFPHGLGDHVQLTVLLSELRRQRPRIEIDVVARSGGAELLRHLVRHVYTAGRDEPLAAGGHAAPSAYDRVLTLASGPRPWTEPTQTYADAPATKVTRAARECLGLVIPPDNHRYHLSAIPPQIAAAADAWIASNIPPSLPSPISGEGSGVRASAVGPGVRAFILVHPRGRCGPALKNLPDAAILTANHIAAAAGHTMVAIDYDGHCRDLRQKLPGPWIDAGSSPAASNPLFLVALAQRAALTIGIDSGPGHLFQAAASLAPGGHAGTRAIIYWHRHHPVNYSDAPDNPHVLHLVPANHGTWIKGDRATGETYFAAHYRHRTYTDPARDLAAAIASVLAGRASDGETAKT